MVTATEKIQFKIQRLKNIQDNLKFGLNIQLTFYISIILFILTLVIIMNNYYIDLFSKLMILIFGFIVYLLISYYFNNNEFKPREKKLNEIAKEIEKYYDQLLS